MGVSPDRSLIPLIPHNQHNPAPGLFCPVSSKWPVLEPRSRSHPPPNILSRFLERPGPPPNTGLGSILTEAHTIPKLPKSSFAAEALHPATPGPACNGFTEGSHGDPHPAAPPHDTAVPEDPYTRSPPPPQLWVKKSAPGRGGALLPGNGVVEVRFLGLFPTLYFRTAEKKGPPPPSPLVWPAAPPPPAHRGWALPEFPVRHCVPPSRSPPLSGIGVVGKLAWVQD